MLKRIISAVVALAIFVPVIILGGIYFKVAVSILSVLAYKELLDLKENVREIPNAIKAVGLLNLLLIVFFAYSKFEITLGILYKGLAVMLISLLIPTLFYKDNKYTTREAFYLTGIVSFLGLVFTNFIYIRNLSIHCFVYLLLICALTDAFAMFTGMLIGKHKVTPNISPKKTIEGCFGGAIIGTTVAVIYYSNLIGKFSIKLCLITLLLSIVDQFGDLFFSKIKRENKIKDFSNIMPGHGGVLDRLDSLCFVSIVYLIFISII